MLFLDNGEVNVHQMIEYNIIAKHTVLCNTDFVIEDNNTFVIYIVEPYFLGRIMAT